MSYFVAGASYYSEFTTAHPTTQAATDADSLPTATATKNGADDATFTLTATKIDTGRYKITGTIPAGYSVGDQVQVSVAATVNAIAGKAVVDSFQIVSATRGLAGTALPDAIAGVTGGLPLVGSAADQVVAKEQYSCSGTVWHVTTTGSDSNDGLSWATAKLTVKTTVEAMSAGDLLLIGAGTFSLGTSTISQPAGTRVIGSGMYSTTIQSTVTGSPDDDWVLHTGCELENLFLTNTTGVMRYPLGWQSTAAEGVVLRNLRVFGTTDALYIYTNGSITAFDCIFESYYDAAYLSGVTSLVCNFYRCRFKVTLPGTAAVGDELSAINARFSSGLQVHLYDCDIYCVDTDLAAPVIGVDVIDGAVSIHGGTITATTYAIRVATGKSCTVDSDVVFDTTKVSGTLNYSYTQPNNAGITAIQAKTDLITLDASQFTGAFTEAVLANAPTSSVTVDPDDIAAGVVQGLDDIGLTAARTAKLDNLTMPVNDIAAQTISLLESGEPGTGSGTTYADVMELLLERSENLDVAVSSRLAKADYVPLEGAGSGAYSITITVTDTSDVALEKAIVRFSKGAETYSTVTNLSGLALFSLDSGTWTVSITLPGYQFTPTTLAISANTSHTYEMTQVTIPSSAVGTVTGYLYCYDEDGVIEENVSVELQFVSLTGVGVCSDTAIRTELSDVTGLVTFTNLVPGATYRIRRGKGYPWKTVKVTATATSPYALTNVAGEEETLHA